MKTKNNNFILIFSAIIFIYNILPADISISASVDKNVVSLNEQISLQITVSADTTNIPQPKIPQLTDFQVYSSGRSQNISIINGQVNSSVTFSYVLVPKKIGEFEIPPITLEYQGKTFQTQPIKIKVEKQTSQQQLPTEKNIYKGTRKDIFIETFVDKKKAYVNEQITLTFRFYTRVNLLSQPQYLPPSTAGFITEDLPPQRNYYTIINSQRYYVSEIKTALFPTSAGKFTIGEATVKCMIEDFNVDDFFSDNFLKRFFSTGKEIILKSEPIEVVVLPLPEPQPQFFSGSVGKYKISSSLEKTKVSQNETVFLNIKISGEGNIKSISLSKSTIETILGRNFLVYDPITSLDIKKENYKVAGTKTFKIPITPLVAGSLKIPEIKFVYFNPQSGQYETTTSASLLIEVTPTTTKIPIGSSKYSQIDQQPQKIEFDDIRYIYENFKVKKIYNKNILILIQLFPFLCWLSFTVYQLYKKSLFKDIKKYKSNRAYKKALKEIKKIDVSKEKDKLFWEKIYNIFAEYLSDKMGIQKEAMSIEEINKFYKNQISQETFNEIISLWEEINFYRFAPSKTDNLNLKDYINKILLLLKKLEDETKKM